MVLVLVSVICAPCTTRSLLPLSWIVAPPDKLSVPQIRSSWWPYPARVRGARQLCDLSDWWCLRLVARVP